MKSIKIIFTVVFCLTFSFIYAQSTSYKGVSVSRGVYIGDYQQYRNISGFDEKEYFCVSNENGCPAKVKIQYKVGSRDGAWIDYEDYEHSNIIDVEPNKSVTRGVGQKIFGLKIIYVHLDCSEEAKTVINGLIQVWEAAGKRK